MKTAIIAINNKQQRHDLPFKWEIIQLIATQLVALFESLLFSVTIHIKHTLFYVYEIFHGFDFIQAIFASVYWLHVIDSECGLLCAHFMSK